MKRLVALLGLAALLTATAAVASGDGVAAKVPKHKVGPYSGKTSEPAPILLLVAKKRVSGVSVAGKASCTDAATGETRTLRLKQTVEAGYYKPSEEKVWKLNRKGRFSGKVTDPEKVRGKNAFVLRLKGKVKGKKASGKVSYTNQSMREECVFRPRRFKVKWTGRDEYGRGPSNGGPRR